MTIVIISVYGGFNNNNNNNRLQLVLKSGPTNSANLDDTANGLGLVGWVMETHIRLDILYLHPMR
jgi:hypothetical protein